MRTVRDSDGTGDAPMKSAAMLLSRKLKSCGERNKAWLHCVSVPASSSAYFSVMKASKPAFAFSNVESRTRSLRYRGCR